MARQKRLNLPGAVYHVITRGLNRTAIFKDEADRGEFIQRLALALAKTKCICYSWALMSNHLHLLLRPSEKSLSEVMRRTLTGYAIYFNRRHKRCGYLYQNRYKSILCQEDIYLMELVRYIHLNPVRAKIVGTLEELDVYPWTGHSMLVRKASHSFQTTEYILTQFGSEGNTAIKRYRDYIRDGWCMGRRTEFTSTSFKRSEGEWRGDEIDNNPTWRGDEKILGDNKFTDMVLKQAEEELIKRERYKRAGWNLERLIERVCELLAIMPDDLKKKGRQNCISFAKGLLAYWGHREIGLSQAEIARYLGMARPSLIKSINIGEKYVKDKDLKLLS